MQLTDREHRLAELRLVQAVQKVALVLAVIQAFEQLKLAILLANAGVMPRRDMVRTQALFESQVMRVARRLPALQMPSSPSGIVGIYDVATDWTPIYDKTNLAGYYVAMGTSGNQFKNVPFVGKLMYKLISGVEAGVDHDNNPVEIVGEYTGHKINIGTYSRKRKINENSSGTVMG
mgnify:CR=1 FL=1